MTNEQTVPVPVDLLKKLRERYAGYPSAMHNPLAAVVALIPTPPEVGDVLTEEQIKALPPKAVLRDRDGDLWVTTERGPVYLTVYGSAVDGGDAEDVSNPTGYAAVLVSLPTPRD